MNFEYNFGPGNIYGTALSFGTLDELDMAINSWEIIPAQALGF